MSVAGSISIAAVMLAALIGACGLVGLLLLVAHGRGRVAGYLLLTIPAVAFLLGGMLLVVRFLSPTRVNVAQVDLSRRQLLSDQHLNASIQPAFPGQRVPRTSLVEPSFAAETKVELKRLQALVSSLRDAISRHNQDRIEAVKQQAEQTLASTMAEVDQKFALAGINVQAEKPPGALGKPAEKSAPAPREIRAESESSAPGSSAPSSKRPEWLDRPVESTYQKVATAGPYSTRAECEDRFDDVLDTKVREFLRDYFRDEGEEASAVIELPADFVRSRVVKEEFAETLNTSFGPMVQVHALLHFDRDVRDWFDHQWNQVRVYRRLWQFGLALASALMLLAVVYGYLKIDLVTRGAYRGRLSLASVVLLAILVAVGAWVIG